MYTLKGFFAFSSLINNARDQVNKFGELSVDSRTYAKDMTIYTDATAAATTLFSFHSVRDSATVEVPTVVAATALKLGQFLLQRAQAGNLGTTSAQVRQLVSAEFAGLITNFTIGELQRDQLHNLTLPEFVSYTDASEASTVTVWLSDEAFSNQYDEYEIEVIFPITPLDDFFKDPLQVKVLLDKFNVVDKLAEVQASRGEYPFTFLQAFRYDYQNPANTSYKLPTYWIVIGYGQAGNNPDIIKQAIADKVLANSTHTRDQWVTILPDLFLVTEWVFTPFWTNYSVPDAELQAGIYSPTIDPRKALVTLKKTTKGVGYTDAWITAQYELSTMLYKSLAFGVVGNSQNRGGITQFSKKFADYMLVTNDTPDANRMSPTTTEFLAKFAQLVKIAETLTRYSNIPTGFARVLRNDLVYVSMFYENVNYVMLGKPSLAALV